MAIARFARIEAAQAVGPDTRLLALVMPAGESLGFRGGQYIIVDSGLLLPDGRAVKRAYSLLSADSDQGRFELAVKRLPGGPGSGFMCGTGAGATVPFSGPWGKLAPAEGVVGPTLVLATDTGISAALGLVRGRRFAALLPWTTLVWLRPAPSYFLSDELVTGWLPAGLARAHIEAAPPAGHPERIPWVRGRLEPLVDRRRQRLAQAFLAGDGAVNHALLGDLIAAGVPVTRDSVESFFNMPKKVA